MSITLDKFTEIVTDELSSMDYVYDKATGRVICKEPIAVIRQPKRWFRQATVTRTYPVLFRMCFNQLTVGGSIEMVIYYSQQKFTLKEAKLFIDKLYIRCPVSIRISVSYIMDVEPESVVITYQEDSLEER